MRAIWWRNERPYDTRALAEPHKMLKLDSRSISIHFQVMSKVTKSARNVQIWRRTENHWHSTAGVMWQASSALMSWNNHGKSTDTDGELLAFITLHNCSCTERSPQNLCYWKSWGNMSLWWVTRPRCPPAGAVSTRNPASLWTRNH